MSVRISGGLPGGNICNVSVNGNCVVLEKELRDTREPWFYFEFSAEFTSPGIYTFRFADETSLGTRGPALSYDDGMTWEWLGAENVCFSSPGDAFEYKFDGSRGNRVIFCTGMQYQQKHLDAFLAAHADNPYLRKNILTHTRKGRSVEILRVGAEEDGVRRKRILLTARHHCCEMMADYALEGILSKALSDTPEGAAMRENFVIYAIPFLDKDGVIDGDQGKSRFPHDHARDYGQANPLYPETRAVMQLVCDQKMDFILDMHCPWIRGGAGNETIYFVGQESPGADRQERILMSILEKLAPPCAPFSAAHYIPWGQAWNTGANYTEGMPLAAWGAKQDFTTCSCSIEIPYANVLSVTLTADAVREFGKALAETILVYFEGRKARVP